MNSTRLRPLLVALALFALRSTAAAQEKVLPAEVDFGRSWKPLLETHCYDCHSGSTREGGLDLTELPMNPSDRSLRERWIRIHDRVQNGEMPPQAEDLPAKQRAELVKLLATAIHAVDHAEVVATGRGPLRRLNRDEYEQNLRDVLQRPQLDVRDILPEDREGHHFNKAAETLDMSRVQLSAYLDAAEAALRQAMAGDIAPPPTTHYRATGLRLFSELSTFGNREAMFFAKDSKAISDDRVKLEAQRKSDVEDLEIEMALFRSASWPYYGYPRAFVAKIGGEYRVRFAARAVLQTKGFELRPAIKPVPLTFRARRPSGADVSGDVRATGGILDIQPKRATLETTVRLRAGETLEYSALGLPVPLARNVNNGPPTYRYPPFPEGGQPGIAVQWLEIDGPIAPAEWPPASHRVLFDDLPLRAASSNDGPPVEVIAAQPEAEAKRLVRRFISLAAREPVAEEDVAPFERLVLDKLSQKAPFAEAMLAGYQAFLCSGHFLYLREPDADGDHHAIASRLSHFLTNTRPDAQLAELARNHRLRDAAVLRRETTRLISGQGFARFVKNFSDYWLNLRHVRRDEPDIRLYPEYRFDDYLVESMESETRAFFTSMIRDNLSARVLVDADFVFANDRLAEHYGLPPLSGSAVRKVSLPKESHYGGLLTQGAILKVTANGTTTSPVVRGAWVMERLIGEPPPPPPTSVPAVEPDIRGAKTIRELLALHTKVASCAACHARFDPVGLALENFDILGGRRTHYRGMEEGERVTGIDRAGHDFAYTFAAEVDAAGKLLDGRTFRDIQDLKAILAADPRRLARNLLHQFTIYGTGTPIRFSDRAEVEAILDACAVNDYRVCDLLLGLVQSKIFLGQAGSR